MNQTMEEYQCNEIEENTSWNWSKAMSVGKKVMIAGVIVSSGPVLVPLFVFAATIAILASVPYCVFLASYACTQKLMGSLLPSTKEMSGNEIEYENMKLSHGDDKIGIEEPSLNQNEDDDVEIAKESTSLVERLRDEGRRDGRASDEKDDEKLRNGKSEDQNGKEEAVETRHDEEDLGGTTNETIMGKDKETASKEPIGQAENVSHGAGEEKPKNTTKKKKKSGRAGV